MVTMRVKMDEYESQGYIEVRTDSGTGSFVLINDQLSRVVKINQDTAYNVFVNFAQSNSSFDVPQIYEFKKFGDPPYEGDTGFTIVEMEQLIALSHEESEEYEKWMNDYWEHKRKSSYPPDNFGLLVTIESLLEIASNNNVCIDLDKSSNIMKRSDGKYVITDPYNGS